jgi:phosphatidylserine/phosphatidylglycerophosphate/cardiolipin synthase-like enzyme
MTRSIPFLVLFGLASCAATPGPPTLTLVESFPAGTTLDNPDLPETADVWRAMLAGARERVELAHFYASDQRGSRLVPIVTELEAAAARGVRVRFLVAATFVETYPDLIARFDHDPDIELRILDLASVSSGVHHAKYMIVDGEDCFLGSANFDWRSMDHIQELGLRARSAALAGPLLDVFEHDWALAGGAPLPRPEDFSAATFELTLAAEQGAPGRDRGVRVTAAFSPRGLLPAPDTWDLPQLVALIEGATREVELQVLTLDLVDRQGRPFRELEDALLGAAARGVAVRILVADWCKRAGVVEGLQALELRKNVYVCFSEIPAHSGGFIPFARVAHSKLLVVDRRRAWIGSSNWEREYFFSGRNAGLVLEGDALGARLHDYFDKLWESIYAVRVDPDARYEPPRRE